MAIKTPETSTTLSAPVRVSRTRTPASLSSPSVTGALSVAAAPRLRSPVSGWYRLTSINVVADSLTTNGKPAGQRSEPERDP